MEKNKVSLWLFLLGPVWLPSRSARERCLVMVVALRLCGPGFNASQAPGGCLPEQD